ncbi:MAG: ABC transporter permease [Breznakibacter sp.]
MNKTILIIKREYLSRVQKKSFVVMCILGPLLFAAMFVLPVWFSSLADSAKSNIAVIDETGKYAVALTNTENITFSFLDEDKKESIKHDYKTAGYDAYMVIESDLEKDSNGVKIYSESQVTIDTKESVARALERHIEQQRLDAYSSIDSLREIIHYISNVNVDVSTIKLTEDGAEKESSAEVTMIAALVFAMLIYFFVLIYGTQVMRGVMEEKTNRIVEVIISSVRPFQLMMGKVLGIALVALTQFLIWVVFTLVIITAVSSFLGADGLSAAAGQSMGSDQMAQMAAGADKAEFAHQFENLLAQTRSIDLIGSLFAFAFFFIGGYLLYASFFAAIGSAIDNDTDGQQFVTPVMMPLILSIYIAMAAFRDPGGSIAFWFSMFPLTSPIVMMARIPFQIPLWEVLLSMAILTASFIFSIWFSARIYRVGILMYGKKVTYKELWKWFRQAGK